MLIALISIMGVAALPTAASPAKPTGESAAVVVLGTDEGSAAVARVSTALGEAGVATLDADALSRRLRGVPADCAGPAPRPAPAGGEPSCHLPPDEEALAAMVGEAARLEADFESERADALRRQVVAAFHAEPRPSERLRAVAGEASVALAASALASGDGEAAAALAREAMLRFAATPVDTRRYPPAVLRLLRTAREQVQPAEVVEVRVSSPAPGQVRVDGNDAGEVDRELVLALAPGAYRVWLRREGELSLPYALEVASAPVRLQLTPALDEALRFDRPVVLECAGDKCTELLHELRTRLAVDEVVGVRRHEGRATQVHVVGASGAGRVLSLDAFVRERARDLAGSQPADSPAGWPAHLWQEHELAIAIGAAGVLAIAGGAVWGVRSRASFAAAGEPGIPHAEYEAQSARGRRSALVANLLFGAGAASLAAAGLSVVIRW